MPRAIHFIARKYIQPGLVSGTGTMTKKETPKCGSMHKTTSVGNERIHNTNDSKEKVRNTKVSNQKIPTYVAQIGIIVNETDPIITVPVRIRVSAKSSLDMVKE